MSKKTKKEAPPKLPPLISITSLRQTAKAVAVPKLPDLSSSSWGSVTPSDKRVELAHEEIDVMGNFLAQKFNEDEATENLAKLNEERAKQGLLPLTLEDLDTSKDLLSAFDAPTGSVVDFGDEEKQPGDEPVPVTVIGQGGGYKLDTGKPRWDLFPFDAAEEVTRVLTWAIDKKARGDKAYPERNWEQGMTWGRCFRALISHCWKWWFAKMRGDNGLDEESGLSHMSHAACTAMFLLAYEIRKMTKDDDRPKLG